MSGQICTAVRAGLSICVLCPSLSEFQPCTIGGCPCNAGYTCKKSGSNPSFCEPNIGTYIKHAHRMLNDAKYIIWK